MLFKEPCISNWGQSERYSISSRERFDSSGLCFRLLLLSTSFMRISLMRDSLIGSHSRGGLEPSSI